jgi:small-conductance mechanosensitive channel
MQGEGDLHNLVLTLLRELEERAVMWQLAVMVASWVLAWRSARLVRPRMNLAAGTDPGATMRIGVGGMNRVLLPLIMLALLLLGRWILRHWQSTQLLSVVITMVGALAAIRGCVYLLRHVFAPGSWLRSWEISLTWIIWGAVALHLTGLLPAVVGFLEDMGINAGKQRITLLMIVQAILWIFATLLLALWISRIVESRLMGMTDLDSNLRVVFSKIARTVLVILAVLVVLPLSGIDITALSVFGGALGVGLGLGLQKVAANYVSGFAILLDRSISPGDMVTIDGRYGEVTKLAARYIVVKGQDGAESVIPNETAVTSTVINHTYSNRRVMISIPVPVSYECNCELAMNVVQNAALAHSRVLKDPAPSVLIRQFGDSSIDLELLVWIIDPEGGRQHLVSDINVNILRAFADNKLTFPYPQREVRLIHPGGTGKPLI